MPYELKNFKKIKETEQNMIKMQASGKRIKYNTDILE